MAAGDVVQFGPTSVAAAAFLDLQPAAGVEDVIHNIMYGGAVELYVYDGANSILFDSDASSGARLGEVLHVTNSKRVRVKNVSAGAIFIYADGIQTK